MNMNNYKITVGLRQGTNEEKFSNGNFKADTSAKAYEDAMKQFNPNGKWNLKFAVIEKE